MRREIVPLFDRLISVLTYPTFGMVGFVWLLVSYIALKRPLSDFTSYHVYQSIFFALFLYILSLFFSIAMAFLTNIPYVGKFFQSVELFFSAPLYFGFNLVGLVLVLLIGYLSLGALLGKYSYLPFISDVIGSNLRR